MKKIIGVFLLLLIVLPGQLACSSSTDDTKLEDVVWTLVSYGETGNLKTVIEGREATAEFVSAEGTVKGSTGCNHYSGGYEMTGDRLTIPENIAATEMYCEGVMDQEQAYLSLLPAAESYEINGNELRINCGNQVLIFTRE